MSKEQNDGSAKLEINVDGLHKLHLPPGFSIGTLLQKEPIQMEISQNSVSLLNKDGEIIDSIPVEIIEIPNEQ